MISCTTPPLALDAGHPASNNAPEPRVTLRPSLRVDASTRRTRELLAEHDQQAAAANEAPVAATPSAGHEHP